MTQQAPALGHGASGAPLLALDPAQVAACAPEHHPRGLPVTLADGRLVSSWSACWRQECGERELAARTCLGLFDKEARHAYLAGYAADQAQVALLYALPCEPAAYGAESRRRLEAVVLARWKRVRAQLAQP